jgi:hypothetical protein
MVRVTHAACSVLVFLLFLQACGNSPCSDGWIPAVGAPAGIRRGKPDRTVLYYGGESERRSGNAGTGGGSSAARASLEEPTAKPRSTAPPVPGPARRGDTNPHRTGNTPEFGQSEAQGLAYDGDHAIGTTLCSSLCVISGDQREDKGYGLYLLSNKVEILPADSAIRRQSPNSAHPQSATESTDSSNCGRTRRVGVNLTDRERGQFCWRPSWEGPEAPRGVFRWCSGRRRSGCQCAASRAAEARSYS